MSCVPMATGRESVCCLEVPNTDAKITGDNNTYITQEEEFLTVCTNAAVIKTAMVINLHDNGPIWDTPENE